MVIWTTPCPYSNMKKGPPMNSVEHFFIQSHHYNKKELIPEQTQGNIINCVNSYIIFNCDTLAHDQQLSAILPKIPL
jgi:hypothetical protein